MKYTFSGHETFPCKNLWLKKGYDFVKSGNLFTGKTVVGDLGVGKNMVSAIKFWLRAFGIIHLDGSLFDKGPGHYLFAENWDPYLEDRATLWLLHYFLVTTQYASIYNLFFNDFRTERDEFTKDQLRGYLKRKCEDGNNVFTPNTIDNDINVFLKNYLRPKKITKNIEDDFSSLLIDLSLVKNVRANDQKYISQNDDRPDIPWQLVLFAILDFTDKKVISFSELLKMPNSVGMVFAMSADSLHEKMQHIVKFQPGIHFRDQYGIRELSFEDRPDKWSILGDYYASN